jgi:hypothetical protein
MLIDAEGAGGLVFVYGINSKLSQRNAYTDIALVKFSAKFEGSWLRRDRLCGLVVRVLGYRSGGPGSIPGTTRFFRRKKKRKTSIGSGTGSTQPREYN